MKKLDFSLEVGDAELRELRPLLDATIRDHFGEGFLRHRWEGDVLRLSGPGAKGTIIHEGRRLRLRAQLKAPASFVDGVIKRKIKEALADVAAGIG